MLCPKNLYIIVAFNSFFIIAAMSSLMKCTNSDKSLEQIQYEVKSFVIVCTYVIVNASIKIMELLKSKSSTHWYVTYITQLLNEPFHFVYVDEDEFGAWDGHNCRVLSETDEEVKCGCDHLTHFAILLVSDVPHGPSLFQCMLS